jgi:ketosteroid isomerase-like protein
MGESEKNVVRSFVEGFARGEVDFGLLAEDCVVDEAGGLPFSGQYLGRDGFKKLLEALGSRLAASVDSCEFLDAGGIVVTRLAMTFSSRATGRKLPARVTELYTVEDGRIRLLDSFYKDPVAVAALFVET